MTSAFDAACRVANTPLLRVFADTVEIDGVSGVAVVMLDTDLALGGGVQLINGAHLLLKAEDWTEVTVNSEVTHGTTEYVITELDDVDSAGMRKARMARA
jgi:hypothetical protein